MHKDQYPVIAARRAAYDAMVWQTPAWAIAAQSFLIATALDTDSSPIMALILSFVAIVFGFAALQLFARLRWFETYDVKLLENYEIAQKGFVVVHGERAALEGVPESRLGNLFRSYNVWLVALCITILLSVGVALWSACKLFVQPTAGKTADIVATDDMELCSGPVRTNCVVDGDTVWIDGEKIRLKNVDAPEASGRCYKERDLSARSAERLRLLLKDGGVTIDRQGKDQYGRTLANLTVGASDLGEVLIREGLARPWRGQRENWCD